MLLKVIGFVNRFSRGVQRVQEELKANGNEEADFNLELETAFLVRVNISKKSFVSKNEAKDETKDETKDENAEIGHVALKVYNVIVSSPTDTKAQLIIKLNVSSSTINRAISELKQKGFIKREGGRKFGYWIVLK